MTTIKSRLSAHKQSYAVILLLTVAYTLLFFFLRSHSVILQGVVLVVPTSLVAWFWGLRRGCIYAALLILWHIFILLPQVDMLPVPFLSSDGLITAVIIPLLLTILIGYIHDLRIRLRQQSTNNTATYFSSFQSTMDETTQDHNRWQFALEQSGDGIWDWDLGTGEVYFSPQWKKMLEMEDEFLADPLQTWEASIHPKDLPQVQNELNAYITGDVENLMIEYRIKTGSGDYIWVLARGKRIKDANGNVVRMIGTHSDITKRRRSEDAIFNIAKGVSAATGEQFFQSVVQYIGEVVQADTVFVGEFINAKKPYIQTIAVYSNHRAAPNFGYDLQHTPCQNVVGKNICVYKSRVAQRFPNDIALAEKGIEGYIGTPLFTAEGDPLGIIVTLYKEPIQNVNFAQSTIQIFATRAAAELERIKAEHALHQSEERLRQAQKMEAIGRLAGGIAHDFNNILTVIMSYGDLLMHSLPAQSNNYEYAKSIREAGEKAATLTHQLLAFSRRQILKPKIVNLNQIILNIGAMLRRLIDENITIDFQLNELVGPIKADASQLELAVMNLLINAKDAMPKGGLLTIATETISLDEFVVKDDVGDYLPEGYYTTLTVTDTGLGIGKDTLDYIFEPFFTTKEQGKGTGLGLAMVHGFVKQSGGTILVESVPHEGTTFKLYFPVVYESERPFGEYIKPVAAPSKTSGNETILLVEDEVDVRNITRDILQLFGYHVIACEAIEALPVCQDLQQQDDGNGRIHLLLTDIIMPGINGYELAEKIEKFCPQLKILYMSGYANEILADYGGFKPNVHFIPKPFTPQELTQKVRTVLDG